MACGKGSANKPIEDFITHSPAPVDLAAKMSQIYHELSFKVFYPDTNYRSFLYPYLCNLMSEIFNPCSVFGQMAETNEGWCIPSSQKSLGLIILWLSIEIPRWRSLEFSRWRYILNSTQEKERAKDLEQASHYCENLCNDFVSIASSSESAGTKFSHALNLKKNC